MEIPETPSPSWFAQRHISNNDDGAGLPFGFLTPSVLPDMPSPRDGLGPNSSNQSIASPTHVPSRLSNSPRPAQRREGYRQRSPSNARSSPGHAYKESGDELASQTIPTSEASSWTGSFPYSDLFESQTVQRQSEGYVDLTEDSPPDMARGVSTRVTPMQTSISDMSRRTSTRSAPISISERRRPPRPIHSTSEESVAEGGPTTSKARPVKRRKIEPTLSPAPKTEVVEEVDLIDIDDDTKLSKALQEEAIRLQQAASDKPAKLSDLQCVICLEKLTDMTVTKCGHLFCHTCLMEALIAGERAPVQQGRPCGRCPICRTRIVRPKSKNSKQANDVIPLEIKVVSRRQWAKGKATAAIRA